VKAGAAGQVASPGVPADATAAQRRTPEKKAKSRGLPLISSAQACVHTAGLNRLDFPSYLKLTVKAQLRLTWSVSPSSRPHPVHSRFFLLFLLDFSCAEIIIRMIKQPLLCSGPAVQPACRKFSGVFMRALDKPHASAQRRSGFRHRTYRAPEAPASEGFAAVSLLGAVKTDGLASSAGGNCAGAAPPWASAAHGTCEPPQGGHICFLRSCSQKVRVGTKMRSPGAIW
jgi:hypothetical protein